MSDKNITKKALTDAKFRADLIQNPKAAIEGFTGIKIPAGLTVKVLEDSASVVHLVLPPGGKGPMSEADLEKVAGGAGGSTNAIRCRDNSNGPVQCIEIIVPPPR